MKSFVDWILIGEIVLQSKIAQRAAERLPTSPSGFDHIEVWCSIQSILVSSGNISKILWPNSKDRQAQGQYLRKFLGVEESNILADRKFRNHFEHYDDRIVQWFKGNSPGLYSDLAFIPFDPIWGETHENHHRAYNQVKRIVTFRGETLNLNDVLGAIEEIQSKCSPYAVL
jgi:hypothetical protein